MSDTSQALEPADGGQVDDGFSAEERQQFADMQRSGQDDPPPADPPTNPVPPADAPPAGGAPAPAAGPGDEDDEDDADPPAGDGKPAVGADGKPTAPPPKRRVSARKFERAEAARVAAEAERDTLRQNQARLDERLKIINEALTTPAAPTEKPKTPAEEDPEPNAEDDVFAWIEWKKRDDARLRADLLEMKTSRQAETNEREVADTYVRDAQQFAASEPNFVAAYEYLMANRTAELAMYFSGKDLSVAGTTLTESEQRKILATIAAEERELVQGALKSRQTNPDAPGPAARVYALARSRGFRPADPAAAGRGAAPAADPGKPAAPAPAGGPAAPAAAPGSLAAPPAAAAAPGAAAPGGSVKDEIDRIKAGTEASRSLSSGGGAPAAPLTAEKLANMPQDQFDELMERLSPSEIKQLMGGDGG